MATTGGANTVVDGLVFGYDTGYPLVSGNSDTYKFNLGQPTENLIGRFVNHYSNSDYWVKATNYYLVETVVEKQADPTAPGGYYTRVRGNSDPGSNSQIFWSGASIGIGQGSGDIDEFGEQVTVSAYLKGSGDVKLQAYDNNTGYKQGPNITLTDKWTYYSFSTTFGDGPSNNNHWVGVREIGSGSSGIDDVYVAKMQWERKTNATPYIQGTRSVSGSLIDLTRTYDIDLSNVSFDSNAQMTFDGTSDYAQIAGVANGSNSLSVEVLFNSDSLASQQNIIFNANGQGLYPRIGIYTNGQIFSQFRPTGVTKNMGSITNIVAGNWYHVLFTYDATTGGCLYVNGVLENSDNTIGNHEKGTNFSIKLGYDSNLSNYMNGKIPIAKIYNRALTPQEVLQNYNALKERFSL